MTSKKPHEMSFTEFAEAIGAGWMSGMASPAKTPANYAEWLIDIWDTADSRGDYTIFWHNEALKNALPPEARRYQFDDTLLHPITAKLGLDPASDVDNVKAAELLAIRNAWIAAIQHHYGQFATDARDCTLTAAVAAEYVLLTSGLIHPWIQKRICQHLAKQDQIRREQAIRGGQKVEMSDDPNWPNTRIVNVCLPDPSSDEAACYQAMLEEKQKNIGFWIEDFRSENGSWSSSFEMDAWYAQRDIDIARQKIAALKKVIENQSALITRAEKIVRRQNQHEASMRATKKVGRPKRSGERKEVAVKFTKQWVKSLMDKLDADSCAQLETMIAGSNERNWQRWINGEAVPTHKSLSALLVSVIQQGNFKDKLLRQVTTEPEPHDLLELIRLI